MEMDPLEDFSGFNDHLFIVKGNRTKRPRHLISKSLTALISYNSPSLTMCSEDEDEDEDEDDDDSNETGDSTVDDEIMANCLIYLAQSGGCVRQEETSKRFNEVVSNPIEKRFTKAGFFVYECKTCNRNFPSFQALGGHRASHKRPKIMEKEDQKTVIFTSSHRKIYPDDEEFGGKFKRLSDDISPEFEIKLPHQVLVGRNHKANKIHECSFCGSEFSSGQALGGHMRRHRNSSNAKVNNATTIDVRPVFEPEKPRRVFQLDLNLPAPEEDRLDLKFQFPADQQQLVLTASAF